MKYLRIFSVALAGLLPAALPAQTEFAGAEAQWSMLENYCMGCHNYDDFSGGVAFDLMRPDDIPMDADTWEKSIRKLRGRLMPPPGSDQPSQQQIDTFIDWMSGSLDATADHHPVAGHVPVQRLSRTEFARAVQELLAVEIDPAEFLPSEIEVDGFENIAAALGVSPSFLDQYINAARFIAHKAVGEPVPKLANVYYEASNGRGAADGLPLGTTGGMKITHTFPADGEYHLNILDLDVGLYPRAVETRQDVIIMVDGEIVFRENLGGSEDLMLANLEGAPGWKKIMDRFTAIPVAIKAGTHDVVFTFVERARSQSDGTVGGGFGGGSRGARFLDGIEIVGPFKPSGISMTEPRSRIFVCQPEPSEKQNKAPTADERACAERIIASLARRAFRRDVSDADIAAYLPYFEEGYQGMGGFDQGIEYVVAAVLVSPDFMYRGISPAKDIGGSQQFALSESELATRLAFFLWGVGPDQELMDKALSGGLNKPDQLSAEIDRMMADPKAAYLVENFAMRWLNVDDKSAVEPDAQIFPQFSDALNDDIYTEIGLFLKSVLLEERPIQELLTASHTFLNDRLARHYGIDGVYGGQFRRVELNDERRWGILGKSAVLLRTSYPDRTSPVLRGAWVLEKIMGTPPAPPPPGVETDLSVVPGQKATTMRARLEKHRENPSCGQCHGVIDPLGLALENFTVTGQWRERDVQAGEDIDASTVLPTGVSINGPVQLREQLTRDPARFAMALTERLMMFALNRELEYFDMPQVREVVRNAASQGYTLRSLVNGIVSSSAFRMQALPEAHEEKIASVVAQ